MAGLIDTTDFVTWAYVEPGHAIPEWDEWIEGLIAAASTRIEQWCRRTFRGGAAFTGELHDGTGGLILRLRHGDVSVTTVEVFDGSAWTAVDASAYRVIVSTGEVVRVDGGVWPEGLQNIRVSGTSGAAAVPEGIKIGCRLLVGHAWFTQGREPTAGSEAAQVYSRDAMNKVDPASGLPLPVLTWIMGYRRHLVAVVQSGDDAV
jgi:hypothetical protein